jgi:acetoacetyl-CoA reductase/3-oxoacyl-[acyl-carrier protein] reductase
MIKKVIPVTGSSRGIGRCLVESFAPLGHRVIINYSKSRDEAEAVYSEICQKAGSNSALLIQADVKDRNAVSKMFDAIYSEFQTCDVVINNAGINRDGPFLEMTVDQWSEVLRTILTGSFNCSQEFARRYEGNQGHIINIGAVTAISGRKNGVNYCTAGTGILNFTRCLALELAPRICVNTVTPGFIATEEVIHRRALHIRENMDKYTAMMPMGRLGTPEDIFRTINFLISESSYITGQNISVDGGYLMR